MRVKESIIVDLVKDGLIDSLFAGKAVLNKKEFLAKIQDPGYSWIFDRFKIN